MEQEMNQSYKENFKRSHTLVNNREEPGAKRFSVIPHWKPAELRPDFSPVSSTKETLRRYLALERKIHMTKNKKLKEGYEAAIRKNIASGMLVKYGRFEDLKEIFMNAYPIEGREEEFVALAPSHLVVQDKDSHPIRLTVDYTTLNNFFSKASNMLNPIESKVLEMRAHRFVFGMDISKQ